jgi:hypothetical protein
MKIQFFLLLNLLTLTSVGQEEHFQLTFPGNNPESVGAEISTSTNTETISGFIAEPKVVKRLKHNVVTPVEFQPTSGRGITINTVME